MRLAAHDVDGTSVISVTGEVDVYTAPRLRAALDARVAAGACRLVVDLGGVDLIDSTGLGVLVGCLRRIAPAGGSIELVVTSPSVARVLQITGLDALFAVHDTVDGALAGARDAGTVGG